MSLLTNVQSHLPCKQHTEHGSAAILPADRMHEQNRGADTGRVDWVFLISDTKTMIGRSRNLPIGPERSQCHDRHRWANR